MFAPLYIIAKHVLRYIKMGKLLIQILNLNNKILCLFSFIAKRIITRKNDRLLEIHFHSMRYWRGTQEYHSTKSLLHVKRLLGHKDVRNTELYIDLESKEFTFADDKFQTAIAINVKEACRLIDTGFEYVTGEYGDGGKIFRKRK